MPFEKGHKKAIGRKKGVPNKLTASVKEAFQSVFQDLQADETKPHSLKKWAIANPTEFYKLSTKLIPLDLQSAGEAIILQVKHETTNLKPE